MTRRSPKRWRERLHSLYRWHRWLGLSAALFLIWLAISGILINHATGLGLDSRHVASRWVVEQYGIHIDSPAQGYAIGANWLTETDNRLWWNDRPLQTVPSTMLGAAPVGRYWFAAGRDWLMLGAADGQVIELLTGPALPQPVIAVSTLSDRLCVQANSRLHCASMQLDDWQLYPDAAQPAAAQALPKALAQRVRDEALFRYIPWERLLRDLHSGRFFGAAGVLVVDFVAIIMVILAVSGLLLWIRYLSRLRRHRAARKPASGNQ